MKKIILSLGIVVAFFGIATFVASPDVFAGTPTPAPINPSKEITDGIKGAGGDAADTGTALPIFIQSIINVLLFIIGAVAVIMIVIGGIRYTISNGESAQITSAKNTILYAVIGLVVAILAYAIVNFVVGAFVTPPATP